MLIHKNLSSQGAHHTAGRGFTLIEMLVVVAIVGILAALAAPSFQSSLQKRRVIAATEAVYAHLQFARSEAVKLGRDVPLNVSIKQTTSSVPWCIGISNTTANCDCNTAGACVYGPAASTIERNLLSSEFPNVNLGTNQSNLSVDSVRGAFGGTAGTVTLTHASDSSLKTYVIFSQLGRVKICADNGIGGYPTCT